MRSMYYKSKPIATKDTPLEQYGSHRQSSVWAVVLDRLKEVLAGPWPYFKFAYTTSELAMLVIERTPGSHDETALLGAKGMICKALLETVYGHDVAYKNTPEKRRVLKGPKTGGYLWYHRPHLEKVLQHPDPMRTGELKLHKLTDHPDPVEALVLLEDAMMAAEKKKQDTVDG